MHDFDLEYNIIFPLILKGEKIIDIKLALKELLPWLQLEGLMKNSISQSSYVELKLAQFARAIIGRPRILLLDNFFSDLEENMEKKTLLFLLFETMQQIFLSSGNKKLQKLKFRIQ